MAIITKFNPCLIKASKLSLNVFKYILITINNILINQYGETKLKCIGELGKCNDSEHINVSNMKTILQIKNVSDIAKIPI